jgi:hypothetical protein
MSPDWTLFATLAPDDLQAALLAEVGAVTNGKSGPEEDRLLQALPEPLRTMWLLNWLDYLDYGVSQGSLLAHFYNSHGRHAPLAVGVLRRIGAHRMAAVVAGAAVLAGRR